MARLFILAVLAAALLVCPAVAVRASDDVQAAADPPKSFVEAGLKAAEGHVTQKEQATAAALEQATQAMIKTQEAMGTAVNSKGSAEEHLKKSQAAFEAFNAAIRAKAEAEAAVAGARELHGLVTKHNALVDRYFETVANFRDNQAQKDGNRKIADSKALDKAKEAAQKRLEADTRLEVAGMESLLDRFQKLLDSATTIEAKEQSLVVDGEDGPGVHAAVLGGLEEVQNWANAETDSLCEKYRTSPVAWVARVRDEVAKASGGELDCHSLTVALVAEQKRLPALG